MMSGGRTASLRGGGEAYASTVIMFVRLGLSKSPKRDNRIMTIETFETCSHFIFLGVTISFPIEFPLNCAIFFPICCCFCCCCWSCMDFIMVSHLKAVIFNFNISIAHLLRRPAFNSVRHATAIAHWGAIRLNRNSASMNDFTAK